MSSTKTRSIPLAGERRRLTLEYVWLVGSTAAFQGSRIVTGIVAADGMPPAEFAAWGIALAILAYSVYFNLGITSGVNRELPQALGAGDARGADRIEDAGSLGTIGASGLSLMLAAVIAAFAALDALAIGLVGAAAAAQQFYLHAQTTLRSRFRFNVASLQQAVLAVSFPLVAIPLLPTVGVSALLVAQVVSFLIGAAFAHRWRLRRISAGLPELRRLVIIGFPIMIGGLLFAIVTTLDRWAVLVLLGDEATGLYTLAALVTSATLLVAVVLAQQFYPRMAHALGRGGSPRQVFRMAGQQSAVSVALVAPISLALVFAGPPAIRAFLPAYVASISAIQILAIGFVSLVAASGFSNYLVVMRRPLLYVGALIAAAAVEIVAAVLLQGFGLAGIAVAASAGYAVLLVATAGMAVALGRQ